MQRMKNSRDALVLTRRSALAWGVATSAASCCPNPPPVERVKPPPRNEGTLAPDVTYHRRIRGLVARRGFSDEKGYALALADMRRLTGVDGYRDIVLDDIKRGDCTYFSATGTPVSEKDNTRPVRVSAARNLKPWESTRG